MNEAFKDRIDSIEKEKKMINIKMKEVESLIKFQANEAKKNLLPNWEIEDLEQEGRLAAVRAYKKFKKDQGVLFTTFVYKYIQRAYLSLYRYENCPKRSIRVELMKDSKEMKEKDISFSFEYKKGTIYNLEEGRTKQSVFSERQLQVTQPDDFEVYDFVTKIQEKLDVISKSLLNLILFPPSELLSEVGNNNYIPRKLYGKYLKISPNKLYSSLKKIRKEILRSI